MEELRSHWKVSGIAHFCYLFRESFKLPEFEYEDLELSFLSDFNKQIDTTNGSLNQWDFLKNSLLPQIIIILLRGYFRGHHINNSNWETYLKKLIEIQWVQNENRTSPYFAHVIEDDESVEKSLSFCELPLITKINIVYDLCEYRFYKEDACSAANIIELNELRVEPLGTDDDGYIYWYFYGTRLYRENPVVAKVLELQIGKFVRLKRTPPKIKVPSKKYKYKEPRPGERSSQRKRPICNQEPQSSESKVGHKDADTSCGVSLKELKESWCVICSCESDWKDLEKKFENSSSECESEFYKLLVNFVPKISELFSQKDKQDKKEARKRFCDLLPRRESSRLEAKKIHRKEEEEREEVLKSFAQEIQRDLRQDTVTRSRSERINLRNRMMEEEEKERLNELEDLNKKRLEMIEDRQMRSLRREYGYSSCQNMEQDEDIEESNEAPNQNRECKGDGEFPIADRWNLEDSINSSLTKEDWLEGLSKVIAAVMLNRDSWPFKEPVDKNLAPLYYDVIRDPIDLSIIELKIKNQNYSNFTEIENDFKLMVNNCETYNGEKSGYALMSYCVWRAFRRAAKKYLNRDCKSEEMIFIFPPKVSNANTKAAIESRRKKSHPGRRKDMKVLEILAHAAEIAVKGTSSIESSPRTSIDDHLIVDSNSDADSLSAYNTHCETLSRYIYNSNAAIEETPSSVVVTPDANLSFKSLSEWSENIKQSGTNVILPHNAFVVNTSPQKSIRASAEITPVAENTYLTKDKFIVTSNSPPPIISNTNTQLNDIPKTERLVIKLSRSNDSWKPVDFLVSSNGSCLKSKPDYEQNILFTSNYISTDFSKSQTENIKRDRSCIPVKKRYISDNFEINPTTVDNSKTFNHGCVNNQASDGNTHSNSVSDMHSKEKSPLNKLRIKKIAQGPHFVSHG